MSMDSNRSGSCCFAARSFSSDTRLNVSLPKKRIRGGWAVSRGLPTEYCRNKSLAYEGLFNIHEYLGHIRSIEIRRASPRRQFRRSSLPLFLPQVPLGTKLFNADKLVLFSGVSAMHRK